MQLPVHILPYAAPCTYLVIGAKDSAPVHLSPFFSSSVFFLCLTLHPSCVSKPLYCHQLTFCIIASKELEVRY